MQDDIDIVEKWLQDESFINWAFERSEADIDKWEEWLSKHPENRKLAEGAKLMLGEIFQNVDVPIQKSQEALERLMLRLEQHESIDKDAEHTQKTGRPYWQMGALALLVAISLMLYFQWGRSSMVILSTGFGEKQEIVLPDQSEVVLNANSTLRYASNQPRKVWLEGEAFFKVKKSETNAKFIVHTSDLAVEVLGTAFNVNSRREQTQVFLEEGKVNLNLNDPEKSQVLLAPGDLLTYSSKRGHKYETAKVESAQHTSWRDGVIELKMTPLREVINRMEDIYGIRIQISNDHLGERKINVAIPVEALNIALKQIEYSLDLNINQLPDLTYVIE